MELQPNVIKNPIELLTRVVISLSIRTPVVEIAHRRHAKKIMHQSIFNIERE
jgi:hypothetical protein